MSESAAPTRRFLISVDDPGGLIQDLPTFQRAKAFFDEQGVPATFFVVRAVRVAGNSTSGRNGWRPCTPRRNRATTANCTGSTTPTASSAPIRP